MCTLCISTSPHSFFSKSRTVGMLVNFLFQTTCFWSLSDNSYCLVFGPSRKLRPHYLGISEFKVPQNFTTWPQVQSLGSNLWLVYQKILMLHLCWNRTVVFSFSLTAASKWRGAILLSKGISARYLRRTHTSPLTSLCKKEKCSGDNLELLN